MKMLLLGKNVDYSLSPEIFSILATQHNLNIDYKTLSIPDTQEFYSQVDSFFINGGAALNVTSPFKYDALKCATTLSTQSALSYGCNLLYNANCLDTAHVTSHNPYIIAHTTDGAGFALDIKNKIDCFNKNVLILGSGAVVGSIILELTKLQVKNIAIAARNEHQVTKQMHRFSGVNNFNKNTLYEVIINTIPMKTNAIDFLNNLHDTLQDAKFLYDLNYKPYNLLQNLCFTYNTIYYNGLGMLVFQACEAFKLLTNKTPDADMVLNTLLSKNY